MSDDFELLDRWRGGDLDAGNALFEQHFPPLLRFFRNKVGDESEDLVQRTLLSCVEKSGQFAKRSSFRTYLFTVARNELYDHIKRVRRTAHDPLPTSMEEVGPRVSAVAGRRLEHRVLLRALRRLPVEDQLVLELYYWEEMSARELGEVVDSPEAAIRSRLRRAKDKLRRVIAELGTSEGIDTTTVDPQQWARAVRKTLGASGMSDE